MTDTLHQPAARQPSAEALDWANDLALAIIADVHSRRFTEAASLIADRLRTVKAEGETEGLALAQRAFRGVNWS